MTRNIKALGLALIAAFAMNAFVASAAQAEPAALTAEEYPATLTGEQITHEGDALHRFTLSSGRTLRCSTASFHGTIAGPATEATIAPSYGDCKLNETFPATVTMEGCKYTFTNGTMTGTHTGTLQVSLVCGGEGPTIHVFSGETQICKYTVSSFTDKTGLSFENTTSADPDDIDLTANVAGIPVTRVEGSSLNCGGINQNATYKGNTTIKAYEDLTHEVNENVTDTEGAQIDLTASPHEEA